MTNLKIGGVPEHFNYPWYITLKNKAYTPFDINIRWTDFPGGTGDMCKALRSGDVDIAIILTEGIIKDISEGNPSKIVQTYVKSPLIWGVHVAGDSPYTSIDDLKDKVVAISRYGSGSHLMAIVNAYNQGWDLSTLHFKVVGTLEGGIEALKNGEADYFMWEHFTTKPWVDNSTFKRVGDCPTPWPCFVIAVRDEVLRDHPKAIEQVLEIINSTTDGFKETLGIDLLLSKRYEQQLVDVKEWLSLTEWESSKPISKSDINQIQEKLVHYKVLEHTMPSEEIISDVHAL
ncbi:ABC transporter substrate-binding protein [Polaribacter pacificus]|uniref:ABC transporter substrate-binding protein n=1 Tax=Polaribacter pacificus TaxID=1775173 RepID=A0A917MEM7_9FLAO|nr:substrate-binding domain-containing protein [Polaribacter pacificus]GGH03448.1 ABC transporter substrate-binding protein [Polaribacter pacificus]